MSAVNGAAARPAASAPRVTALSVHADFRCAHSGACCASGWTIPIEHQRQRTIEEASADGRFTAPLVVEGSPFLAGEAELPDGCTSVLATDAGGCCAFYDRASGLCAVQRDLGHDTLPSACQHFPRVCLIDDRGVSMTLSHYCPTAAGMLFDAHGPLTIVENPGLADQDVQWEGLDVRGDWPPLLQPGRLMDLDAYDAWERFAVGVFSRDDVGPEEALALLGDAAERVRTWTPLATGESLTDRVRRESITALAARLPFRDAGSVPGPEEWLADHDLVRSSLEPGLEALPPPDNLARIDRRWVGEAWSAFALPLRRYLATKVFASWLAYQGHGLRTIVRGARLALSVVRVEAARACTEAGRTLDRELLIEAIRVADLLLLHLASRRELARRLSAEAGEAR